MDERYRIAVASGDGKNVDSHFGRAESFYIYDIVEFESMDEIEIRFAPTACMNGVHDTDKLLGMAGSIKDCKYVIATRIGPGARKALEDEGIEGF